MSYLYALCAPKEPSNTAEHAHAADRFAHEIIDFLTRFGGALAAADGQPVGLHLILPRPISTRLRRVRA